MGTTKIRNMIIKKQCWICKTEFKIVLNSKNYREWKKGMLIQNALSYLSIDEREILINGCCYKCFDKTVKAMRKNST